MQSDFRNHISHSQSLDLECASVSRLVTNLVVSYEALLVSRNLRVAMDVQPIDATIDAGLITTALTGLLENAIETSSESGPISITSIDGPLHWEIEVADSSHPRTSAVFEIENVNLESLNENLPLVQPFSTSARLATAYQAACKHHGKIQNWECSHGGLVYVLVIPRRMINAA